MLFSYPGFHFLAFDEDKEGKIKYYLVSQLKAFFLSLFKAQVFFTRNNSGKYDNLDELIQGEFKGDQ